MPTLNRFKLTVRLLVCVLVVTAAHVASASTTEADPSFGVAAGGVTPLPPGAIVDAAPGAPTMGPLPAPAVALPPGALGLPAGAEVDAISYGNEPFPPPAPFFITFSVAPGSGGHPGSPPFPPYPNVTAEMVGGDLSAQGDIYASFDATFTTTPLGAFGPAFPPAPCGPILSNHQIADEDGLGPLAFGAPNVGLGLIPGPPAGPPPGDNLDTLDMSDPATVDFAAPAGVLDAPVFFSVSPATAAGIPPLPPFGGPTLAADVLVFVPGAGLFKWATAAMLGMGPADDIDALAVDYVSGAPLVGGWVAGPDNIGFSLVPGSPSLPLFGGVCFPPGAGTAGDVFADFAPLGAPPGPGIDAEMLGLNTIRSGGGADDNVDAIDLVLSSGIDLDGDLIDDAVDFDDDFDLVGDLIDNCPGVPNPGQANNDIAGGPFGGTPPWIPDGVGPEGVNAGGDACDINDDNDRSCTDGEEAGGNINLGGARSSLNPWDFADVPVPALTVPMPGGTRNGVVLNSDALAVVFYIGTFNNGPPNVNGVDYDTDLNGNGIEDGAEYDRTSAGPISGPPNGAITGADALVIVNQVGDNCTALPN